jgi:hypothetical protein
MITSHHRKLVTAAAEIISDPHPNDRDRAFMARQLIQATLPHSNPGDRPVWRRTNGRLTLTIRPTFDAQDRPLYPYGTVPRLLLFWLTTQVVRTGDRRIELGDTLAEFMRAIGLNPASGGLNAKRSDARRLRDQMTRLFRASISFEEHVQEGDAIGDRWRDMTIAPDGELWWSPKQPNQPALFGSWIMLGERFYEAIRISPVPLDMRALRALKRSPMALDMFAWATYEAFRAWSSGKARAVPWRALGQQLGADYTDPADMKKACQAALRKVRVAYPALRLESITGGIKVLPSPPAIPQR